MYQELERGVLYEKEEFSREEAEEYKQQFLEHVGHLIDYFATDNSIHFSRPDREMTTRERLEMLAFCMLSAIDGESGAVPGFLVIPIIGEETGNFLPESLYCYDIAGSFHDNMHKFCK